MTMTTEERYAEAAYEAYKVAVGGKSIKGEPLPKYIKARDAHCKVTDNDVRSW